MRKIALVFVLVVRVLSALAAAWQVVGLLPVLTWLSALGTVTVGMWFMFGIKVLILLVCLFAFFGLKRLASRLREHTSEPNATA